MNKEEAWNTAIAAVEKSWCQGSFKQRSPEGDKHCVLGAIGLVAKDWTWEDFSRGLGPEMVTDLAHVILDQHASSFDYMGTKEQIRAKWIAKPSLCMDIVWRFNDRETTTKQDVIAMMEKARARECSQ